MSARFVTLEGGEGVGKSTQARALATAVRARGHDVVETREPGGSPGAEAIRALLLEGAAERWTAGAEALLFAAARADHVARTIRPALARGAWVVCDRFLDSSLAYQGGADGIARDALMALHRVGSGGLLPDRTLLLTLPEDEALARARARPRRRRPLRCARRGLSCQRGARIPHARGGRARAFPDRRGTGRATGRDGPPARRAGRPVTLFGHDAQIAAFAEARASGRLHHAWLLTGPEGVGKASFARAAALRLLADAAGPPAGLPALATPEDHRIARLWRAGSHPDAMILDRLYRDKTRDVARSISVDQVRGLSRLFATAPSFSPWRVVIVDAADDLERAGANALLKLLEEPPGDSLFLLVSHAPARLLPTIRSRCRVLRFAPLDNDTMADALRTQLPEATEREIADLVAAGDGAPGRALRFAGLDVAGLDRAMDELIRSGDRDNGERSALARALSGKTAQARYELFLDRAPSRIAAEARRLTGAPLARAIEAWEQARTVAGAAVRLSADPQATVFELGGLLASLGQNAQQPAR